MPKAKKVSKSKSTLKRSTKKRSTTVVSKPSYTKKSSSKQSGTLLVLIILALLVIAGLYSYSNRQTPTAVQVMEVGAASKIALSETFGDGKIDKGDWNVGKSEGVSVVESKTDLLRMNLPSGPKTSSVKSGYVAYKNNISPGQDFSTRVTLFKPIVKGDGIGRAGVRFVASEAEEPEGAFVQWVVEGNRSEIVFSAGANGQAVKEIKRVAVTGQKAQLVLRRVEDEYVAFYRMNNFDDDNLMIELGSSEASALGGRIRLFTNSSAGASGFHDVVGRFDSVAITSNLENKVTSASFRTPGELDANRFDVSTVGKAEKPVKRNGNLIMQLPASDTRGVARAFTKDHILKDLRGVGIAEFIKPDVKGDGAGSASLYFVSDGDKNDESAHVRWQVSGSDSTLIFVVADASGKLVEKSKVAVPNKVGRMTIRLVHGDGKYTAFYRYGAGLDDDASFKKLGEEAAPKLGAKGRFGILTHQFAGKNGKFPAVIGRYDSFTVNYIP